MKLWITMLTVSRPPPKAGLGTPGLGGEHGKKERF